MKKWICVKNNVVTNIVVADDSYMENNPEIAALYDSFYDFDQVGLPEIKLGSRIENGVWITGVVSRVGVDYKNQNLTGMSFRDCNLDGCDFSGSFIDDCDFRGAQGNFSLLGAIWGGNVITKGPVFLDNPYYYSFVTDVFTAIGCLATPTSNVVNIKTPADHAAADPGDPTKPAKWWLHVKDEFLALLASWGM